MDKDCDFLFEAYQQIYEAPVGPGSAWGDEVSIDPSQSERLGKSQYGQIGEEDTYRIIQNIKEFLEGHEGSVFPGSMDDLKLEIKVIIQDTVESVNGTKAGYAARVIRNELKRLNIIQDVAGGDNIIVKDVEKVDGLEDKLGDALELKDAAVKQTFKLNNSYEVTGTPEDTLSPNARKVLAQLLDTGDEFVGRDFVKRVDNWYEDIDGLKVAVELFNAKAIVPAQSEVDDDEDRVVDVGDEDDDDDRDVVNREYERLRRDISGGESPVMRPDDF
jgi:hypothetical protein